jgi:hypothetical protein
MAIKKKGDLSFKRQAGARGPAPDSVYDLYRREEEWIGQETDLTSFLASKPKDSAHPTYAYLKLYEFDVTLTEAGMATVRMTYTGHPNGLGSTSPTKRFQKMLKTSTVEGQLRRNFFRWVNEDPTNVNSDKIQIEVTQTATAEINYRYYTPSITYRYSSSTLVTSPRYAAQAATDLAGQSPTIVLESSKKTGTYLHSYSGVMPSGWLTNGDDLSAFDINGFPNQQTTVTVTDPNGNAISNTAVVRAADLVAEQRGTYWEVEETHEIELQ